MYSHCHPVKKILTNDQIRKDTHSCYFSQIFVTHMNKKGTQPVSTARERKQEFSLASRGRQQVGWLNEYSFYALILVGGVSRALKPADQPAYYSYSHFLYTALTLVSLLLLLSPLLRLLWPRLL